MIAHSVFVVRLPGSSYNKTIIKVEKISAPYTPMHPHMIWRGIVPLHVCSRMMSGYWIVAFTPKKLEMATTIVVKRGMMCGERIGSNQLEMEEIEAAATTMNIGLKASFKAKRSENVRSNPTMYMT